MWSTAAWRKSGTPMRSMKTDHSYRNDPFVCGELLVCNPDLFKQPDSRFTKVIANSDLGDIFTLKPNIFWLAIQGLSCIAIEAS